MKKFYLLFSLLGLLSIISCSKQSDKEILASANTKTVIVPKTDNGFHRWLIKHNNGDYECIRYRVVNCMDDVVIKSTSTCYNKFRASVLADTISDFLKHNDCWIYVFPELAELHSSAMDSVKNGYYKIVLASPTAADYDIYIVALTNSTIYPTDSIINGIKFSFPAFRDY